MAGSDAVVYAWRQHGVAVVSYSDTTSHTIV
jgi:hypothetical protein